MTQSATEAKSLSGFEYCLQDAMVKFAHLGLVPRASWDSLETDDEKVVGYDQAFGGEWIIKERGACLRWVIRNDDGDPADMFALRLTLMAEIPLHRDGTEMQETAAQRRWFLTGARLVQEFPATGGSLERFSILTGSVGGRQDFFGALEQFNPSAFSR